jgi:non-specific serine/threonine protein kinase
MEPALPTAVQETAAAATSDRLFVVGGYDAKGTSTATVFVFDGTAWTTGPALPIAVNHPGAASVNGTVYEAGGFAGSGATARAFALDAGAPAWREIAPMHHARGALALLAVAGKLYAIGGRSGSTQIAPTEVYDPSADRWTDVADLPRARNHVAGYVDGARACVAGGREPDTSSAINCFDTATGTWAPGPALKQPTSGALAALVGGALIVAGGEPSGETSLVTVVQEWRNGWTTEPMLVPRHGTGYAAFQGRVWACGGATAPGVHATAACTSFGPP